MGSLSRPRPSPEHLCHCLSKVAPKEGTPGKRPDRDPGWTRRPTPQPCRHMTGLDVAVGPRLVSTVSDAPETPVQIVSLFVQITQYKNETDASIESSYQTRMQLKEHHSE